MDIDWLRNLCLSFAHATEHVQWGDNLVFKVGGKIFAIAPLEPSQYGLSFKCSDEDFAELVERPGIMPAPYLARAHWIALESDCPRNLTELEGLLRKAHKLVFAMLPKAVQQKLNCNQARAPRSTRPRGRNEGVQKKGKYRAG